MPQLRHGVGYLPGARELQGIETAILPHLSGSPSSLQGKIQKVSDFE